MVVIVLVRVNGYSKVVSVRLMRHLNEHLIVFFRIDMRSCIPCSDSILLVHSLLSNTSLSEPSCDWLKSGWDVITVVEVVIELDGSVVASMAACLDVRSELLGNMRSRYLPEKQQHCYGHLKFHSKYIVRID